MTKVFRRLVTILLLWFSALPLWADDSYDALMAALAQADNQAQADQLSGEIWQFWLTAPDGAAQEVLDNAMQRRQAYDFLGALDHLDRLIDGWPDYAEGWNQRATVHFLRGDYAASLADVAETLAREPRHFGALAGKAMILFNQGNTPLAQIAVREALQYHPFLHERVILDIDAGEEI